MKGNIFLTDWVWACKVTLPSLSLRQCKQERACLFIYCIYFLSKDRPIIHVSMGWLHGININIVRTYVIYKNVFSVFILNLHIFLNTVKKSYHSQYTILYVCDTSVQHVAISVTWVTKSRHRKENHPFWRHGATLISNISAQVVHKTSAYFIFTHKYVFTFSPFYW